MKNLWEKLNPDIKERIENDSDEYPALVRLLKKELESNNFVNDLLFGTVSTIWNSYSGNIFEDYNFVKINNLFQNESIMKKEQQKKLIQSIVKSDERDDIYGES